MCYSGTVSIFGQRKPFLPPVAYAAIHRDHVGVAHLLQVVGGECGTEPASAVEDHLGAKFGYTCFNVSFDDSLAQMNRAGQMVFGELTLFAHVDEQEFVAPIHPFLHFVHIRFPNACLRVVNDLKKPRRVLVGHENLLQSLMSSSINMVPIRPVLVQRPSHSGSIERLPLKVHSRRIGLARALSKLGYCSRSQAAELIRAGRVRLNAKVRRDPEIPVRLERDAVEIDGKRIEPEQKVYLMMNKPRGLVTTASDEKGRETIYSVLQNSGERLPWVAPVGRLDKASEGLLLLTNDSEWGAQIADPETHLEKTYQVQIGPIGRRRASSCH